MSQNNSDIDLYKLIQECLAGKRSAQGQLYALFAPKMFVVCLRYAKNREEAEEILQEGFMKVFKSLAQFRNAGSFEGWVRKIMVNCALQKCRSKTHLHAIVPIDHSPVENNSYEDITSQIDTKELLQLVQSLPAAYRMVFNLYVFEGMKHREIAKVLGISEGTSKSNLYDARAILQKTILKKYEVANKNISCL